jgi:hypothetical protein
MAAALVHIGTHKTGTTSFQHWAQDNRGALLDQGMHLFEGKYALTSIALPLLCTRPNRTTPPQRFVMDYRLDEWRADMEAYVAEQVAHPAEDLLVSAEDLSLLRFPDEVERLVELLAPRTVRVAVCLRDPDEFLRSYRAEMNRLGEPPSDYPSSHTYYGNDTWLTRWDEMLATWRSVIGDDKVVAFSYEDAIAEHGSTIPGVLEAFGIAPDGLPSWESYLTNVTAKAQRRKEWSNLYAQARRTAASAWLGRTVVVPIRRSLRGERASVPPAEMHHNGARLPVSG